MNPTFDRVWQADPALHRVLRSARDLREARDAVFNYLDRREIEFCNQKLDIHSLEWSTVMRALQVMKQVVSVRNEKAAGFSALRRLLDAAHGRAGESSTSPGFKEEFRHLFLAASGRSRLQTDLLMGSAVPPKRLHGRAAALVRSDRLDRLAAHAEERIRRYPTGLDPAVARRRAQNRLRILAVLGGSEADWQDYRWHLRHVIRDAEILGRCVRLGADEVEAIDLAKEHGIPFGVTPYYASLMDHEPDRTNDHSVRAQVIPSKYYVEHMTEQRAKGAHSLDFMHEHDTSPVDLVTHIQHVYEVTAETMQAVQAFRQQGLSVYNQMVFTRENSRRFEATALRRLLRLVGVDPYYSFNTKGKEETLDFRVPIARLRQEQKEEARLVPGLVRTDEAVFNVPGMGKNYLRGIQHHMVVMVLPDGRRVYEFHPWEKHIRLAPTHLETDVSIWDYLEWLKSRGEDLAEYRSIWYYY